MYSMPVLLISGVRTNEDVHTVCMYIHFTVYMFIQANIHMVCIRNVISASDSIT